MNKKEARAYALKNKHMDKKESSLSLVNNIIESNVLEKFKHIGIYYPIGDEMSVLKLLSHYPDKSFYLPITKENIDLKKRIKFKEQQTDNKYHSNIDFISYKLEDPLYDGKFKTKEPKGAITRRDDIECFIIPCVAISKDNKRVGYGKGYYDRYLEGYSGLKIGVCYKENILDVVTDSYDISLDIVFTG